MKKMYEWIIVIVLAENEEGKARLASRVVKAPNIQVAARLSDEVAYDVLVEDSEAVSGEIVNLFRGKEVVAENKDERP